MSFSSSTLKGPNLPATGARSGHHRLPDNAIPGGREASRPANRWKSTGRRARFRARRCRRSLEQIPDESLPAILELRGGSHSVILLERIPAGAGGGHDYLVQFPDFREALIRADRLEENYDGICILIRTLPAPAREKPADRLRSWMARLIRGLR